MLWAITARGWECGRLSFGSLAKQRWQKWTLQLTQVHIKTVHFARLPNDTLGLAATFPSTRSATRNYSNEVCLTQMNKKKFRLKVLNKISYLAPTESRAPPFPFSASHLAPLTIVDANFIPGFHSFQHPLSHRILIMIMRLRNVMTRTRKCLSATSTIFLICPLARPCKIEAENFESRHSMLDSYFCYHFSWRRGSDAFATSIRAKEKERETGWNKIKLVISCFVFITRYTYFPLLQRYRAKGARSTLL